LKVYRQKIGVRYAPMKMADDSNGATSCSVTTMNADEGVDLKEEDKLFWDVDDSHKIDDEELEYWNKVWGDDIGN
jgi:hypothetical protein